MPFLWKPLRFRLSFGSSVVDFTGKKERNIFLNPRPLEVIHCTVAEF